MNLISWNCRGLGAPHAVREVTKMVHQHKPLVVFLMETKRKNHEMEWLRSRWKFDCCFTVDGTGRWGGLALLWMMEADIEVLSFSKYHINVKVEAILEGGSWRFIGFHGDLETSKRYKSWDLLRQLKEVNRLPWLCVGDFNEIISMDEKIRGTVRPESQMLQFRETLADCNFQELKVIGGKFTWAGRKRSTTILERLDRGLVTENWLELFPYSVEQHMGVTKSDHVPLIFNIRANRQQKKAIQTSF